MTSAAAIDCDVLVLGAGPAGSTTATHLARAGFDVVLADQKAFPRQKPCGEFLSPECRPYLAELGVDEVLRAAGVRLVHGMQLHAGDTAARGAFRALGDRPHAHSGYAVRREVLDLLLLDAARARPEVRWLERARFRELLRGDDGRIVGARLRYGDGELVVRARRVIGADGVRSQVAAGLGVQRALGWLDRLALVGRFDGVPPAAAAEVHFVPGGYFAATTVDDDTFHLNLVVDRRAPGLRDGDLDAFVAAHLQQAPRLQQRMADARRLQPWRGTGPLAFRTTRQALPGAALVGDACGYVDPLTGEGIYFALHGARALAAALEQGRAAPRRAAAALRGYERERRREVGPRSMLSRLLQRGMRRPWIVDRVVGLLAAHPSVCDLLVTMTGDTVHPRDLLRPSFWRQWRATGVTP
ncbi:MAG: NAD(P)/FAD-dependent oxidoreductase [Planctomycetota bacterium]